MNFIMIPLSDIFSINVQTLIMDHNITEILIKLALNSNQSINLILELFGQCDVKHIITLAITTIK